MGLCMGRPRKSNMYQYIYPTRLFGGQLINWIRQRVEKSTQTYRTILQFAEITSCLNAIYWFGGIVINHEVKGSVYYWFYLVMNVK